MVVCNYSFNIFDAAVPSVQEVVTILYSKLINKMGHYFLDIQYNVLHKKGGMPYCQFAMDLLQCGYQKFL